jgi:hypothetical protein
MENDSPGNAQIWNFPVRNVLGNWTQRLLLASEV